MQNALDIIGQSLAQHFPHLQGTELSPAMNLKSDLGIDSIALVQVLVLLEEAFGMTLDDDDLDPRRLSNVGDLVALAAKHHA